MFRYLSLNCRTPRGLLFFHIFQANKAWSTCARRHNTWWDKAWENTTRPHSLPVSFHPQTHPQNDPNQSKHLNNMYYSQKELSQEIASDTKQSRLLSFSRKFYLEQRLELHWIWAAINGVFQAKRMSHTELPYKAIDN